MHSSPSPNLYKVHNKQAIFLKPEFLKLRKIKELPSRKNSPREFKSLKRHRGPKIGRLELLNIDLLSDLAEVIQVIVQLAKMSTLYRCLSAYCA